MVCGRTGRRPWRLCGCSLDEPSERYTVSQGKRVGGLWIVKIVGAKVVIFLGGELVEGFLDSQES